MYGEHHPEVAAAGGDRGRDRGVRTARRARTMGARPAPQQAGLRVVQRDQAPGVLERADHQREGLSPRCLRLRSVVTACSLVASQTRW